MPADTSARYYTWYMTEDATQRILAFQWWPEGGKVVSSLTMGKLLFIKRDDPSDVWEKPETISESVPWVVAQTVARNAGCNVEVSER